MLKNFQRDIRLAHDKQHRRTQPPGNIDAVTQHFLQGLRILQRVPQHEVLSLHRDRVCRSQSVRLVKFRERLSEQIGCDRRMRSPTFDPVCGPVKYGDADQSLNQTAVLLNMPTGTNVRQQPSPGRVEVAVVSTTLRL